jgi:fatty acid desaturase
VKASDILSREEIARFTEPSNLRGAWAVARTWGVIGAAFALLAAFPHPLTFVLAVVVLGGRQLALAVLMHEAAHKTLFRGRWLNDVAADWLCARPVWGDVARYRKHHVTHHAWAGSEKDPDRTLVTAFPVTRGALARKLMRDVVGIAGLRRIVGLLAMDFEVLEYNVSGDAKKSAAGLSIGAGLRRLAGVVLPNAMLLGVLLVAGHAWVFSAWAVAWLTSYGLFLRVRSFAEHACTEVTMDPFRNTRTTAANFVAQATVAPLNVNFHLEHHLLVSVPWFRLPALHALLAERGALKNAVLSPGYLAVARTVSAQRVPGLRA